MVPSNTFFRCYGTGTYTTPGARAYSLELREHVVRFVEAGHSRHAAAAHFQVSVSFTVTLMNAYYTSGRFTPKPVAAVAMPSLIRIAPFYLPVLLRSMISRPELSAELLTATGTKVEPASLSRWLIRNGYRFKKNAAGERARSSRCQSGARGMDDEHDQFGWNFVKENRVSPGI